MGREWRAGVGREGQKQWESRWRQCLGRTRVNEVNLLMGLPSIEPARPTLHSWCGCWPACPALSCPGLAWPGQLCGCWSAWPGLASYSCWPAWPGQLGGHTGRVMTEMDTVGGPASTVACGGEAWGRNTTDKTFPSQLVDLFPDLSSCVMLSVRCVADGPCLAGGSGWWWWWCRLVVVVMVVLEAGSSSSSGGGGR